MTELTIRDARRDDVPAIMALLAADSLGATREPTDGVVPRQRLGSASTSSRAIPIIGRSSPSRTAGSSAACSSPSFPASPIRAARGCRSKGVRVAEDCRRKGIGRRMFDWAIADARSKGVRLVQLTHHTSRGPADAFYRSLGFTPSHIGMKLDLGAGT